MTKMAGVAHNEGDNEDETRMEGTSDKYSAVQQGTHKRAQGKFFFLVHFLLLTKFLDINY